MAFSLFDPTSGKSIGDSSKLATYGGGSRRLPSTRLLPSLWSVVPPSPPPSHHRYPPLTSTSVVCFFFFFFPSLFKWYSGAFSSSSFCSP